jgi:hypothetical protein
MLRCWVTETIPAQDMNSRYMEMSIEVHGPGTMAVAVAEARAEHLICIICVTGTGSTRNVRCRLSCSWVRAAISPYIALIV